MKFRRLSRRSAVSEVVGSILTIAITIIAGSGVWAYVNTQAGNTESLLGRNVAGTNNFLSEQFRVIDMALVSATSTTVWVFNVGSATYQLFRVRLYDSAGLMNLQYNYTVSGGTKTDYVYDLRSSSATQCKTAASLYESPALSAFSLKILNSQSIQFTVPGVQVGCPSFGQLFLSGTTYTVVVTGLYGTSVTYFQVK